MEGARRSARAVRGRWPRGRDPHRHAVRFNAALRTETDSRLQGDLDAARRDARRPQRPRRGPRPATSPNGPTRSTAKPRRPSTTLAAHLVEAGIDPALPAADIAVALGRERMDAARRGRERTSLRPRAEVEEERAALVAEVADRERPGWAGSPMPPPPPAGTSLLRRRHAEVMKKFAAGLAESVDHGPSVPLVLDEPLAGLAGDALTEWLDAIVDRQGQTLYLTEDPAVAAVGPGEHRRRPHGAHRLQRLSPATRLLQNQS